MAITLDTLAAALSAPGSPKTINKASAVSEGAGTWHSLWKVGSLPAAGANPPTFSSGSSYIPTRATTGAVGQANAGAGNNLYLAGFSGNTTTAGSLILYDRLWACSGFGTVVTTAQNITTPGTLTAGRDPNSGADVEPWLEVYTAPGATTATWTVTGTDSTGTTGRTWTYTHPANAESVGQMMPLNAGTAVGGMRAPASFQASASSGTAGDIGLTLMRRIGMISVPTANIAAIAQDAFATGLPEIYDDACLAFMVQCTVTGTGQWLSMLSLAELTP